jgi:hypothetical protein
MISHDHAGLVNATAAVLPANAGADKSVKAGYCQNVAPDPGSGYAPRISGLSAGRSFFVPGM